ncbi:MAG: ABC transporter substrate-binding protein [Pseudomonadota bacterium]|nr:ABC transporter substrate-binding protein [Pseudomonadota bacterium]
MRLALLPFALVLSACPPDIPADAPAEKTEGSGDTLIIGVQADVKDFLPVLYQSSGDGNVVAALNVPLLETDFDCELHFKPAWAKSWTFSEDGRTIRMELDDRLTWADGTPVTAEDLRFAYELVADPAVASPQIENLARVKPGASPRIVGPTTIEFEFTEAYDRTRMLAHIGKLAAVPKHVLDNPSVDRRSLREHPLDAQTPMGNGAWKLASWEKGLRLVLEPNERFSGPDAMRPKLGRVILEVLPDYAARLEALRTGAIDLMADVLVTDADALASRSALGGGADLELRRRGWRTMDYVAWNEVGRTSAEPSGKPAEGAAHPLFGDREIRRALAMAIDTDALIRDLLTSSVTGEVYGRPAVGTVTPALCGVHNDAIKPIPYGPEDARARLRELGWADANADGWLDKDGLPFRFTLLYNDDNPRRGGAAERVAANLRAVGVDVVLEPLHGAVFFTRLRTGDYDAALSGWSASLYVDPSVIWGPDSEFNFTRYRNPEVARLLREGLAEPDSARSAVIWQELQQIIYEDQPYAFLYWTDEIVAVDKRFLDAKIDVLGAWRDLASWHVSPGAVRRPIGAVPPR